MSPEVISDVTAREDEGEELVPGSKSTPCLGSVII